MENKDDNNRSNANQYLRYSGLGFQMIFTIGLFTYAGIWIDDYWQLSSPIFTIILSLLGVMGSLIVVVRGLTKDNS